MPRIFADSFYVDGVVLDQAYWQALDNSQVGTWNGDVGTSHNPTTPVIIGGAGLWISGPSTFAGFSGTGIVNFLGSGTRLVHGNNDWIRFQIGAANSNRVIETSLGRGYDASIVPVVSLNTYPPPSAGRFRYKTALDSMINVDPGGNSIFYPPYSGGARLIVPFRPHHNGVLQQVQIRFTIFVNRVPSVWAAGAYNVDAIVKPTGGGGGWFRALTSGGTGGSQPIWPTSVGGSVLDGSVLWLCMGTSVATSANSLPSSQPKFRVIGVDQFGNVTPCAFANNGFQQVNAATAAAYYNGGGAQSFTYLCDPPAFGPVPGPQLVDITKYSYYIQIEDEADPNWNAFAGNIYTSAVSIQSSIPDLQPG